MAVSDAMRRKVEALLGAFERREPHQDAQAFWQGRLPHDKPEQSELAEAFDRTGVDLFNRGDAQAALGAFWPNFLLRLELVRREPADRGAIRDFASAEDLMGVACLALGRLEPAETMLSEALTYRRGLFRDDPADAHAAYLYGVALNHMGQLARAKGEVALEQDYMRQARDHLVEVDRTWPRVSFIEVELAQVRERLDEID